VDQFLQFTILGLVAAAIYGIAASGLVVTYTTSGIFNFAHGAIGMMAAFMFWQLSQGWDLPVILSLILVLVVIAPLFGAFIDLVIMRGLEGTSEVTKTVVSVGLLFGLIALAPIIWPPTRNRVVEPFFGDNKVEIAGVFVSYHQLVIIAVAVAVAVGLRLFLFNTRSGVAMRAVVANRGLVQLNGGRPGRASSMSWALGCALAALGGILVAERLGLEVLTLTLLVLNAYAAAIVGRLASLPMTFVGAIILGLAESYAVGYMPSNPDWLPDGVDVVTSLRLSIPVIMLFIVLLILPQAPLRAHGLTRSRESVPKPTMRLALMGGVAFVAGVGVWSIFLDNSSMLSWGKAFGFGLVMLSLVPLTGYGGQISLAQMSFAGLGAFAMAIWGDGGNPLGLLAAFLLPAVVGAIVALPALRLRGIYLALSTLAFAIFMDRVVFSQERMFPGGNRTVDRLELPGLSFAGNRSFFILMAAVLAIVGIAVVWLRLSPFGRRLQAMKDSPAACATLGLNLTVTKLQVFALSAGIAGLGGAMIGGLQGGVAVEQFNALQSLPILLMAVAGGISMVSGAIVGGFFLASFPIISDSIPTLRNFLLVAPGLIGITLARNPNGAVNETVTRLRQVRERFGTRVERTSAPSLEPLAPTFDAEMLGVERAFTPDDVEYIDRVLTFNDEEVPVGTARS
jgi:branched-chain amino acid transport system permease protein